jgi:hypothetical protein
MTDSIDAIEPMLRKARAQPLIGQTRSVLDFVQPDTPARQALRARIAGAAAAALPDAPSARLPDRAQRAAERAESLANGAQTAGAPQKDIDFIRALGRSLRALQSALETDATAALERSRIALDRAAQAARQLQVGAGLPLREALPPAVRDSFVSANGRFAVLMHPKEDIWEPGAMAQFVRAMREVDPSVTGAPITVFESMHLMKSSFLWQGLLASAFVIALMYADFRSLKLTAIAFLSLVAGLGWTVGVMGLLSIPFTLANFFAIPIMIGLGIDSAIHITHRVHEGGLVHGFGSTRRAVIVTALTTTIDFGTLLFVQHRGLRGLGAVMTIASVCCLVSAVWLRPSLLRCAGEDKAPAH